MIYMQKMTESLIRNMFDKLSKQTSERDNDVSLSYEILKGKIVSDSRASIAHAE